MRTPMIRQPHLPASLRTLLLTHPGDRLLADCVVRGRSRPGCARCLPPAIIVLVRDNGPDGVIVTLPDGTDRRLDPNCASRVQVEPVNGIGVWAEGRDGMWDTAPV